jgi:TolB-like protein/DNA-binding winged helix-turn-helix (wHTH) protein/Flp pilus assembly protein TadD
MELPGNENFLVGEWRVFPPEGVLKRGEEIVRLEPKAMEVLVYLIARAGEVVTRDDLEREVWHGAVIGYDAVTNAVIKLRKAFADDTRQPAYIATIPKRGYRLLAPVRREPPPGMVTPDAATPDPAIMPVPSPDPAPSTAPPVSGAVPASIKIRPRTIAFALALALTLAVAWVVWRQPTNTAAERSLEAFFPRTADLPSLVVLPFSNLSDDPGQRYLSDGVTEDLIAGLSKIAALRVIARNSAFAFSTADADPRKAAAQLGVRYVLQGSLRKSGQKLRVTAKLIDAESGAHLWAEQFDGGTEDLFALQDRVAEGTVTALSVTLTQDERKRLTSRPMTSFAAYDLYLRGRAFRSMTTHESELARSIYRRALQEDSRFAPAYIGLAVTYIDDILNGRENDMESSANEALKLAEQALALDETLSRAHFALGYVHLYGRGDHARAIAEARRALALAPNNADAYALLSSAYFFAGELDKTEELDREARRLSPAASFVFDMHRGRKLYLTGHYQEALEVFLVGATKDPTYVPTQVWLAATYAKLGQLDDAQWTAEQLRALVPGFAIDEWLRRWPYKNPEQRSKLAEGLKAAGLPQARVAGNGGEKPRNGHQGREGAGPASSAPRPVARAVSR